MLRVTGSGLERMLVVCDTLDLPPGVCRLKRKGSSAGHKGLSSIISRLGTGDFMRLYVGIGRPQGRQENIISHVLGNPEGDEAVLIENAVQAASDSILKLSENEPEKVMNALNKKGT